MPRYFNRFECGACATHPRWHCLCNCFFFFTNYTFCNETLYVNQQSADVIQNFSTCQVLQEQFTPWMWPIFQICIALRVQCIHPRYMELKVALYEQSESCEMRCWHDLMERNMIHQQIAWHSGPMCWFPPSSTACPAYHLGYASAWMHLSRHVSPLNFLVQS